MMLLNDNVCNNRRHSFVGKTDEYALTRGFALLVMALSLMQTGCTSLQVRLGWKVYLDRTPITSIAVSQPKSPGIVPGNKSPLVVSVTQPDGKVLQTEGAGRGRVLWSDLALTSSVVTISHDGIVSLPDDPRLSDGKIGHVTITVPGHPDLRADLDIPIRYDAKFIANFSGRNGAGGMGGSDGSDGASGSMGSIDPDNPSAGGDGGNGTDGSNGEHGGSGGDAPPVRVRVALRSGIHPLLQLEVAADNQQKFFLVDPNGGSLTITADGGSEGSGGRGGTGGHGGLGGTGTPNGSSGSDGLDGHAGSSGWPGKGGSITVVYDPDASPFLKALHLSSRNGPRPVFTQALVTALW